MQPVLYALDCEMVETAADQRALVRVCVVDAAGESVLDVRTHTTTASLSGGSCVLGWKGARENACTRAEGAGMQLGSNCAASA